MVVAPAALFHDVITYPKDDPRSTLAQEESAELAMNVLRNLQEFPVQKIEAVGYAIEVCSFSKEITPETLEAKILQDADGLEATGAIAIMRTFASTGQMGRPFYHLDDPFAESGRELDSLKYAVDLFYVRLLQVAGRMHTTRARKIALRRTDFLNIFLEELSLELVGK